MQKLGLIIAAICLAFGPISAIPAAEKPTSGDVLTLVPMFAAGVAMFFEWTTELAAVEPTLPFQPN